MADDPQTNPNGTTVSGPRGTILVGPISTQATAAPNITLPTFLVERNIFRPGAVKPTPVVANFVPKSKRGQDPATLALQTVNLFDFNFCGRRFAPAKYRALADFGRGAEVKKIEVKGVGQTLALKLLAAQENIFKAFALERIRDNLPIDDEKAFDRWCALRQPNGGYGFRGGPHFGGSAIDLNTLGCPYVATGLLGPNNVPDPGVIGGEVRRDQPPAERSAMTVAFTAALLAYDNAVKFAQGDTETFDLSPKKGGETFLGLYVRFDKVSRALAQYFSFGYDKRAPTQKLLGPGEVHAPVDIDTFVQRVSAEFDLDPTDPDGFAAKHPSFQAGMAGDRKAFLTPFLAQMQLDHDAICPVMIQGNMKFKPDPSQGAGGLACDISTLPTRDPCFGFLDLRLEIVEALLNEGLRWGAAMFSDANNPDPPGANGDIMHFDLGPNVNPDLKPDPNPESLGYSK